jgi:hypothetical protein
LRGTAAPSSVRGAMKDHPPSPSGKSRLPWWLRRRIQRIILARGGRFLCDKCRFDHDSVCNRRVRPNARECPDYERSGPYRD